MKAMAARGLLRNFNDAGVLDAADVHVADRLGRLGGERDEAVLLAVALTVRAVRQGSVCLALARVRDVGVEDVDVEALPWPEDFLGPLRTSPLTGAGVTSEDRLVPLRLIDDPADPLLYLDRYYRQERTVADILDARARTAPAVSPRELAAALAAAFPGRGPDRQRLAARVAATSWTTVVTGGPGTGKTRTVARLIDVLRRLDPTARIAVAAPTGKAAARLGEEVAALDLTAVTLHRLLGWRPDNRSRFRHHAANPLPYDVVVVDECSMVSLTMMSRLLEAVRPQARLVLVGDADQLTSVEAGAVLADLVARPASVLPGRAVEPDAPGSDRPGPASPDAFAADADADADAEADPVTPATTDPAAVPSLSAEPGATGPSAHHAGATDAETVDLVGADPVELAAGVVRLERGYRFTGAIARLAAAVRAGDSDEVLRLLHAGGEEIAFHAPDDVAALAEALAATGTETVAAARAGDATAALDAVGRHRLLCAHRRGPYGVAVWDRWARTVVTQATASGGRGWYAGLPLLVTENDYDLGVWNGDTGVVIAAAGTEARASTRTPIGERPEDRVVAVLDRRPRAPIRLQPSRLAGVQPVYAMTIHRAQGSQYDAVTVVLPDEGSALLTRELLYTALTRARTHVRILGTEATVRAAVERRVQRASGLRRSNPTD